MARVNELGRINGFEGGYPAPAKGGSRYDNLLPGQGPWKIEQHCPAKLHNTLNAARGRRGIHCVCPRALFLKEIDNFAMLERKRGMARYAPRSRSSSTDERDTILEKKPLYMRQVKVGLEWPRLEGGLCSSRTGRRLMDLQGINSPASMGERCTKRDVVEAIQAMCSTCPLLNTCARLVLEGEVPAGSWGGVWAGMTAKERKAAAR